ncbi:IclR family transcriptional regulator [Rhodococcus sp. WS1]|uniref:IclR family transcriptional regulator n=1 Tax=unclassified Rhodococcus (in: high G+C Gram-positive bacteria) TaxID=192944 RepID=UPI0011437C6F|nr:MULTISPECIES: IclR family transcriptional regulator C-terminal domain-containing protein [unclassified Rhodococcus (in: high G+C Gram-positive bacteria)]ROZ52870.1 IclR family transcriptional regulator [Rhodococcus sp. WS1]TQC35962.1 IclR family transcriptional regulator [Rhodococcus sp. WS7]
MPLQVASSSAVEHRTVSRIMGLVEAVVASEPTGLQLSELSRSVNAPKTSVHGLAKGLVALGYLQESSGRYVCGPAIASLLGPAIEHRRWRSIGNELSRLSQRWNETAMIGVLVGDSVVYVQSVESTHSLRAAMPLNTRVELWPASSGKCLLAFMSTRLRDNYLAKLGIVDDAYRDALMEIAKIREQGVAVSIGTAAPVGMFGISSPVVTPGGPVTMTVSMTGPEVRQIENLDDIAEDVRRTAALLAVS